MTKYTEYRGLKLPNKGEHLGRVHNKAQNCCNSLFSIGAGAASLNRCGGIPCSECLMAIQNIDCYKEFVNAIKKETSDIILKYNHMKYYDSSIGDAITLAIMNGLDVDCDRDILIFIDKKSNNSFKFQIFNGCVDIESVKYEITALKNAISNSFKGLGIPTKGEHLGKPHKDSTNCCNSLFGSSTKASDCGCDNITLCSQCIMSIKNFDTYKEYTLNKIKDATSPRTIPPMNHFDKKHMCDEAKFIIHKTTGLLNFLGGNFSTDDLHNRSFADIVNTIVRNGGTININHKCQESDV